MSYGQSKLTVSLGDRRTRTNRLRWWARNKGLLAALIISRPLALSLQLITLLWRHLRRAKLIFLNWTPTAPRNTLVWRMLPTREMVIGLRWECTYIHYVQRTLLETKNPHTSRRLPSLFSPQLDIKWQKRRRPESLPRWRCVKLLRNLVFKRRLVIFLPFGCWF